MSASKRVARCALCDLLRPLAETLINSAFPQAMDGLHADRSRK